MEGLLRIAVDMVLNDSDDEIQPPARRPRFIRERIPHFDDMDDVDFVLRFRFSKEMTLELLSKIDYRLEYPSDKNYSVSPINQVLLCLRYYATGCTQLAAGDFSGVSVSTANRIVNKVSRIIASMYAQHIYFPRNQDEMDRTKIDFYQIARFPRVIGAIDCTHIKITSPGGDNAEYYRNRKGYFSLNVQGIVNNNLEFSNVVARWPGSAHDQTIFDQSLIRAHFEHDFYGDAIILGDSAYSDRKYCMTPLSNPLTREEIRYNESQIRTRNAVERVFGVWKRRFPVLAVGMRAKLKNVMPVIIATAVLFNILRRRGEPDAPDDVNLQMPCDQDGRIMPWDRVIAYGQMDYPANNANNVRNELDPYRQTLIRTYFRTLNEMYDEGDDEE